MVVAGFFKVSGGVLGAVMNHGGLRTTGSSGLDEVLVDLHGDEMGFLVFLLQDGLGENACTRSIFDNYPVAGQLC